MDFPAFKLRFKSLHYELFIRRYNYYAPFEGLGIGRINMMKLVSRPRVKRGQKVPKTFMLSKHLRLIKSEAQPGVEPSIQVYKTRVLASVELQGRYDSIGRIRPTTPA